MALAGFIVLFMQNRTRLHAIVWVAVASIGMLAAKGAVFSVLTAGQFRVFYLRVREGGWASGYAYSPTLRRMISLARLDPSIRPGSQVRVRWGGFSDEPARNLRATVRALPFIAQQRGRNLC